MTSLTPSQCIARIVLCALAAPDKNTFLLESAPGLGKTSAVKQAAAILNTGGSVELNGVKHDVPATPTDIVYFHLVTSSPEDFGGVLVTVERCGMKIAEKVPFARLVKLLKPEHLTFALLDDVGQSAPSIQAVAMQLVEERHLDDIRLGDNVMFVLCTNRRKDKAGVSGIIEPLRDRMRCYPVHFDVDAWSRHAIESGNFREDVIAFVRWHERYHASSCSLADWKPSVDGDKHPTPRGVEKMSHGFDIGLTDYVDVQAVVGSALATSWTAFKQLIDKMPDIDLLLKSPQSAPIPDHAGVQFALTTALLFKVKEKAANMAPIITYLDRFASGPLGIEQTLICKFIHDLFTLPNAAEVTPAAAPLIAKWAHLINN